MLLSLKPFIFLLLALLPQINAQTLLASLDYGTFQGAYSSTYNITYFRKIPFAAPPVGENRFRAPQPPIPITNGTYDSDQAFDYCPQRTVNGTEDCLYLGLYSRPWVPSPASKLRPVVVVFFGGAFIQGGGSFSLPPSGYPILNASTSNDFIFVYPNYRVNAFGFLSGREVGGDGKSDLNAGLLDQRAVLKWVGKYIDKFGGDKEEVTVWGQSAGGGSVVAQVIGDGVTNSPPLFKRALASSPFWPKTYKYDSVEAQSIYDRMANLTGCTGAAGGSLKCLKALDVQKIRDASLVVAGSHTYNSSSYTWAPVIEGEGGFITKPLSEATMKKEVNIEGGWGIYNTHEGENFIPPGLSSSSSTGTPLFNSSTASFNTWLRGFLPNFSDRNIARVQTLYPESGTTETSSYNGSYTRAGLVYRDIVLACPAYWMARAAKKGSWVGEYSISPAKHASDTIYWNQVNAVQKSQPLIYNGYAGAFASFFQTGDPNAHKLTNASIPGVPENWRTGEEFVVKADGFANVKVDQLGERCGFWRSVAGDVPI